VLAGGAKKEELVLPSEGKEGKGVDQASDGLGPEVSASLHKSV
jgi:hypothetical protein